MQQKKRFILKVPYILATQAGSQWLKLLYSCCFLAMLLAYFMPFLGNLAAIGLCLTVWQFINIKYSDGIYSIYNKFLLQRVIFYAIFVFSLLFLCSKDGTFDIATWSMVYVLMIVVNISDICFMVKGLPGIGFINADKK